MILIPHRAMPHMSSGAEGLPPTPPRSRSWGTPQHSSLGNPSSAGTGLARGLDVPICNKGALHRPDIWEVLMGGRERFQAWGSSQMGWNGLVDVQGDTTSERLRSVMVIRAGDTGRQMSHSEIR